MRDGRTLMTRALSFFEAPRPPTGAVYRKE
jgi:hypothetical protein